MINMTLDASTTCIGWGIFEDDELLAYGKLIPTNKGLGWRERIQDFIPQLHLIIKKHHPQKVYIEDVPLIKRQMITLVQLGATQGMILGLCCSHNIDVEFINVGTWRKNIGLYDGTKEGKERDVLKQHSIKKANKLFNLDLMCTFTKSGNYNSEKSDDDIADALLIYASTREMYKNKGFGIKI